MNAEVDDWINFLVPHFSLFDAFMKRELLSFLLKVQKFHSSLILKNFVDFCNFLTKLWKLFSHIFIDFLTWMIQIFIRNFSNFTKFKSTQNDFLVKSGQSGLRIESWFSLVLL